MPYSVLFGYQVKKIKERTIQFIKLVFSFYSKYAIASILVTLPFLYYVYLDGYDALSGILGLKTMTYYISYLIISTNSDTDFLYYKNLGMNKTTLWIGSFLLDFLLTVFFCASIIYFR